MQLNREFRNRYQGNCSRNKELHLLRIVGYLSLPPRWTGFSEVATVRSRRRRNAMEMRVFGRTGMQLSVLGFGCGAVGGLMVRGDPLDQLHLACRVDQLTRGEPAQILSVDAMLRVSRATLSRGRKI